MSEHKHCKLERCVKSHEGITCHPNGVACEFYVPPPPPTLADQIAKELEILNQSFQRCQEILERWQVETEKVEANYRKAE